MVLRRSRRRHPREQDREDEKRERVDREEHRERRRLRGDGDRAADDAADAEAEIHGDALLCEGHVTLVLRCQEREQARLRRPERAAAGAERELQHDGVHPVRIHGKHAIAIAWTSNAALKIGRGPKRSASGPPAALAAIAPSALADAASPATVSEMPRTSWR